LPYSRKSCWGTARHGHTGRSRATVHQKPIVVLSLLVVVVAVTLFGFSQLSSAQLNTDTREAAFAQKADKLLKQVRRAVDEDRRSAASGRLKKGSSQVEQLSQIAAVERRADNVVTVAVSVMLSIETDNELRAAGFQTESRVGKVATLQLDVDHLPDLAALSSVRKIFAAAIRHPVNDRARQSAGIDNPSGQRVVTQTGRGVVVGIIDTGIDFRHLDFTVPGSGGHQTRIKALLDMTVYGSQSPDPNWNYTLPGQTAAIGHLYTEADINSALQASKPVDQNSDPVKERDKSGHGTHVAGTAAGNGLSSPSAGTYAGMAPEGDLIIVKASRENDGNDGFRTTDEINAMEFIKQKAAELGEPFVINISFGDQLGPHDGTLPDERAIDSLVSGGAGRAVCVAAGNDGDSSIHARGTVPTGGSQTLEFNVNGTADFIDLYQANTDRFSVTVTRPDGTALGPVSYDPNGFSLPNGQASDQYLQIYNANDDKGDSDPTNDQPDIFIVFKPGAPNGMWKITLQDADNNPNQPYDAWAEGIGVYFSTYVDNDSHLVASPGTARGAVTVGAFVTRSATQTIGGPASFTSPGPTADGRQKPEISAPGYFLYSARSTDVTDPNFGTIGTGSNAPTDSTHYTGLAGTSMATPVTTGSVALLIQSSPSLSGSEIKNLLTTYAVQDIFTGAAWGARLGLGKVNIANSISRSGGGFKKYSISGRMTNQDGSSVSDLQIFLSGYQSAMARTDSAGNYNFADLSAGGSFTVTPSFQGGNISYSPGAYTFNGLSANQTANFVRIVATGFDISGRIADANGNGISGIRVELPGSTTPNGLPILPAQTDANGNYIFSQLAKGGNYNVTPTSQTYSFTPNVISFTNLSSNQTANFLATAKPTPTPTPSPIQLILDQSGPDANQAAALDSVLFLRDPFQVVNSADQLNPGTDRNTRLIIFVTNLQLAQGEPSSSVVVNLTDSNNQSYDIAVEDVRPVLNFGFTQVIFRLPDNLSVGTCTIKVKAHAQVSNAGTIRIRI